MKILQKMAVGSDWGRFVYFAGEENFDWHKEVGGTSNEKQKERDEFYAKLGADKQVLKAEVGHTFTTKKVLSTQLAEFFGESTDEWSVENHKKTFDALNRLTKLGYNVDRPSEFKGLKLVILADNKIDLIDLNTKKSVLNTAEAAAEADVVIEPEQVAEEVIEEALVIEQEQVVEEVTEDEKLLDDLNSVQADAKTKLEEVQKKSDSEKTDKDLSDERVLEQAIIDNKKQIQKIEGKTGTAVEEVVLYVEPTKEELTKTVLSADFLTENTTEAEEKVKLEPVMAEIKKTKEAMAELQGELDQVNQDFSTVKAKIQKALEGQFEKGKLEELTPAQIEEEIKDNKKYENLYAGLAPLFNEARELEDRKKYLSAVVAVDALYDEDAGYKSRYDVKEEDIADVKTEEKTEFGKKYEVAEKALQDVNDGKVENQGLFIEMTEGYERARLVSQAKEGMEELADLDTPDAKDFPKTQTIKAQITEARTHGAVNEMFEEGVLVELLQKERRSSHMQAKKNAKNAYGDERLEEYKNDLATLTEKDIEKDDISSLISLLATAMTHPLNKKKDPEVAKDEAGDEKADTWDTKHLEQGNADGIEALILRREQLEKSFAYSESFEDLFPSNHVIFAKEKKQGKDKTWLSVEDVDNFQKLETELNGLVPLYVGKEVSLLQGDLERQYGGKFAKRLEAARANVEFRLNQPDMVAHKSVKPKVDVKEETLSFVKVEKKAE